MLPNSVTPKHEGRFRSHAIDTAFPLLAGSRRRAREMRRSWGRARSRTKAESSGARPPVHSGRACRSPCTEIGSSPGGGPAQNHHRRKERRKRAEQIANVVQRRFSLAQSASSLRGVSREQNRFMARPRTPGPSHPVDSGRAARLPTVVSIVPERGETLAAYSASG